MTAIPARPAATERLFGRLRAVLAEALARRAAYLEALRDLEALDQRELDDLGIGRGELPALAREAARGR